MKIIWVLLISVTLSTSSAQTTGGTTQGQNYAKTTGNLLDQGTISVPSGVVTSPGFPGNYPPNVDKTVSIILPLHSTLEIYFDSFDTQECFDCNCDFVDLTFFSRFCGSKTPDPLITRDTMSQYFEVRFHSDASDERKGFSLRYNIYPTTTSTTMTMPPSTTPPCPNMPCPPSCPPKRQYYWTDYRGCSVCDCEDVTTTVKYPMTTMETKVANSFLLQVLMNLKTQAEALEIQAKGVQQSAEMVMALTQQKPQWSK